MTKRIVEWAPHARALAERVTDPVSRWRSPIAAIPRHRFVPTWWETGPDGWTRRDGATSPNEWLRAAYADRSLVTRVGPAHADHTDRDAPEGKPTSSATLPSLLVKMFRLARLAPGLRILDVGTGSGYGTALLSRRFGDQAVASIDVDPYLVSAAVDRLADLGLHPDVRVCDALGPLPGAYDRIVATVGMPTIPASWVEALRPGGRLVATIAAGLIVTATKQDDGTLRGRVEWERAAFMAARSGADYPPGPGWDTAAAAIGEDITVDRFPVLDVQEAWDIRSMLEIVSPGIEHRYAVGAGGVRVALMTHPDGSWARATGVGSQPPEVHQGGGRRLWDALAAVRSYWVEHGELPVRGAAVLVPAEGGVRLARGGWRGYVPPSRVQS